MEAINSAMGARGFEEDELRGCAHGTPPLALSTEKVELCLWETVRQLCVWLNTFVHSYLSRLC